MLDRVKHPERFVGHHRNVRKPYFEGWYFRHTSSDGSNIVSIIPGISYEPDDPHAFIQVISSPPINTHVFRFPLSSFSSNDSPFSLTIGSNRFSLTGIDLDLSSTSLQLKGSLRYGPLTKIKKTLYAPTIMGPFAYLPGMECNHGIISMSHTVSGTLLRNNIPLSFEGGSGYIEKDWGKSFPTYYYWLQSNHFKTPNTSFIISIARIPYLGMAFPGFFCVLHHDNHEYRFATYTCAKIHSLSYENHHFSCEIQTHRYQLIITSFMLESADLLAPKQGKMDHTVKEGLTGVIHLRFMDRITNQMILDEDGIYAGLEFETPDKNPR